MTAPAAEIAVAAAPAPATAIPPAVPPPAPASPAYGPWKDGTFQGVGSARHGQIQATVVITDGRIASAKIEQCWMRYPCYQIDRIVPQVAQRGTPEKIDIISGATESSNVFYWAVMDALTKAK
ncbi:MAG: FMN-binding protein [Candidatus Solibacter sp.]